MSKELTKQKAIELLRCAIINCDNSRKIPQLINLLKIQIKEALKFIESQPLNWKERAKLMNDLLQHQRKEIDRLRDLKSQPEVDEETERHWTEVCHLIATLPEKTPNDETWQTLRKWLQEEIKMPIQPKEAGVRIKKGK
jgi:hypothetical protein